MAIVRQYMEEDQWLKTLGFESGEELQELQDQFSRATGLFLYCVDHKGLQVTELSDETHGVGMLFSQIGKKYFKEMFRKLTEDSTQEQIIDKTDVPGIWIAAQPICIEGKTAAVWMVFAVMEEGTEEAGFHLPYALTEEELYTALDFLRGISRRLAQAGKRYKEVQRELLAAQSSQQGMAESMKRLAAVMELVKLLENEEQTELVLKNILQLAGSFLQISSAQVFKTCGDRMELLAEWLTEGARSLFDRTSGLKRLSILYGNKKMVISQGTELPAEQREELCRFRVGSTVILPVDISSRQQLYICFNVCGKTRSWEKADIRFMESAVRILQNIMVRREQKASLANSHTALVSILEHTGSAVYVQDLKTHRMLFANRILKRLFERELEEGGFDELLEQTADGEAADGYELYHMQGKRWYEVHYTETRWTDGRKAGLYVLYDITDKKTYQQQIEQQTYIDARTGLYNRICCERDLAFQIDEARKNGKKGTLLYLDLDDFKHINDGLGHQQGDVLLQTIAHSFRQLKWINNSCYRMGGDEFAVIIPSEYEQKSRHIIEEVKNIFNKSWSLKDNHYYCTMSMGVVAFPEAGESVHELIKKAELSMYDAKKKGKNRIAYYSDSIQSLPEKRLDMEKNMRDAAMSGYGEFEVYYQPIIKVSQEGGRGNCCGAEALIRWNSSEMGFISPADFIPLAEYLGLINPIGTYVLREACRECKKWNDSGHPDFRVNVNLSVVQLLQPDIVEVIAGALQETGINPKNLMLEVTENLAINDMSRMKAIMSDIRALGAGIALDDFGTGYSSLNHIRELPFDTIKIDQSFVKDLHKDDYSQAFIKMVTELADAIHVNVCVEGIETREQYEVIKGMLITMIQGYYFDRPMQAAAFEAKYTMANQSRRSKVSEKVHAVFRKVCYNGAKRNK